MISGSNLDEVGQHLTEDDLVAALAEWLKQYGFEVKQALTTKQKGVDIVAERNGETWLVEAKGGTSSRVGSPRAGRSFSRQQVVNRVSKAFFTAAELWSSFDRARYRVFIALPDDRQFREVAAKITPALKLLNIGVFWGGADGGVSVTAAI